MIRCSMLAGATSSPAGTLRFHGHPRIDGGGLVVSQDSDGTSVSLPAAHYLVTLAGSVPGPSHATFSIELDGRTVETREIDAPSGSIWPCHFMTDVRVSSRSTLRFRCSSDRISGAYFRVLEIPRAGGGPDDGLRRVA